jgi:hypothetical protein
MSEQNEQPQVSSLKNRNPDLKVMIDGVEVDARLQPQQPHLHVFQPAFKLTPASKKQPQRIVIDIEVARGVAKDLIRAARAPAFLRNDGELIKAYRTSDKKAEAAAKENGQRLADTTKDPRLVEAKTPDELYDAIEAIISEL